MKPECNFQTCQREQHARGLCFAHYEQQHKGQALTPIRRYVKRIETPAGYEYCTKCENIKKREQFYSYANGNPHSRCKQCTIESVRARYLEKKEQTV